MLRWILLTTMLLPAACGDDDGGGGGSDTSGVEGTKGVTELSADEVMQFCEWSVALQDGPREVECGDGVTISIPDVPECVADYGNFSDTCAATVSQAEACIRALDADPCGGFNDPACEPVLACAA